MRWRVLCGVVLTLTAAEAKATPAPADQSIVAMDVWLQRFSDYGYSISILSARDGKVVLNRAYGPGLTTRSVFETASLAKQFTATAVLKLAQDGRLSLSDPVTRFFPEAPAAFADVTVDHLLAHTSGIRDDYGLYAAEPDLSRDAFRARILARPLGSRPGEEWDYSNDGYALLAMIIEKASGEPYTDYLRRILFQPAGLKDTGFMGDDRWLAARRPVPFGGTNPPYARTSRWVSCLGPACIVTNPSDLFRWETAVEQGRVLSPAMRAKLTEPQI